MDVSTNCLTVDYRVLADAKTSTDVANITDDDTDESTQIIEHENDANEALYYFSDNGDTDGSMKTGKNIKIELDDGETYTFGFEKTGKAINGLEDKTKIYKNGLLLTASSDYNYQALTGTFAGDSDGTPDEYVLGKDADLSFVESNAKSNYVISKSGSVLKKGSYVKDADDNYYAVNDNGEVAFFTYDNEYAKNMAQEFARYDEVCGSYNADKDRWDSSACK